MKAVKKDGKLVIKVKKGALHKELGVDKDKKLTKKETEVNDSDSPLEKKRKIFAQNARRWNH